MINIIILISKNLSMTGKILIEIILATNRY